MESKTIKISKENYLWLLKLAAEIQRNYHRPVSFDEAINKLKTEKMKKGSLLEFAGRWKMSDEEAEKFKKDIRKGWKKWEIPSF
jgi:predicted CopG family antitoxin